MFLTFLIRFLELTNFNNIVFVRANQIASKIHKGQEGCNGVFSSDDTVS